MEMNACNNRTTMFSMWSAPRLYEYSKDPDWLSAVQLSESVAEVVESKEEHEEVPKEEAAVETSRALKKWHGDKHLAIKVLRSTEEMDPGQWWTLEKVGRHLQRDNPLCYSCTA
jgi:hypothetical protein